MADYTKTTNFTAKDNLSTGNALKVIKGSYFDTEFDAIATAIATKYDTNDLASQANAEAETSNAVLMTPLRVANWADYNAGMVGDIQALTDPGADTLLGWDDSSSVAIGFTAGAGIVFSTTTVTVDHDAATNFVANEHIDHTAVDVIAGAGMTGGGDISADRTLNVIGGTGITVNANDIELDGTAVMLLTGTTTIGGVKTFSDSIILSAAITTDGVISPTQLLAASTADDYAPTGYLTSAIWRMDAAGAASISGIAGGVDGRRIVLSNVGSYTVTLTHEAAGSTAANRYLGKSGSGDAIAAGGSVEIRYDGTSSRWRPVGGV